MDDRAIVRSPVNYDRPTANNNPSKPKGGFDFFSFPFFGPSIICIIIIGGPNGFFKYAKGFGQRIKTRLLESTSQKKLDSGVSGKPLMIPVAYGGIQGILSGLRGVDDDANVLAAGTLTGLLYKASSGNLTSCGAGGLTGLLLSSLYCLLKSHNAVETIEEKHYRENSDFENQADDYWKPK